MIVNVDRLTDRARKALRLAEALAVRLGHPCASYPHLLIALGDDTSSVASVAMRRAGCTRDRVETAARIGEFSGYNVSPETTRRCSHAMLSEVINQGAKAATTMGDGFVGTEHLLLGLIDYDQKVEPLPLMRELILDDPRFRRDLVELFHPPDPHLVHDEMASRKLFDLHMQVYQLICEELNAKHDRNDLNAEMVRRSLLASRILFFVSQELFPAVKFGPSPLAQMSSVPTKFKDFLASPLPESWITPQDESACSATTAKEP